MPNHVTNLIEITGDPDMVEHVFDKIKNDEYGIGTIDFEKIIPMPDNIYKGDINLRKRKMYGKNNWRDWSIANWGTKWNAYEYNIVTDHSGRNKIEFFTAWSAPHPVIEKLAEMFPDIQITHEWADDDVGNNCGMYRYANGKRTEEYFPETKKEGMEFAAYVMGRTLQQLGYVSNASESGYFYAGEIGFKLIKIAGQTALYSNYRMTSEDIPKGMYCYDLRKSEDGGHFCTIEKNAAENHGGSIVTKKPLDFGRNECIPLTKDTEPYFAGEIFTFEEFMDYYEI